MTSSANSPRVAPWMGGVYLGSLVIAVLALAALGAGVRGTTMGLQLTARWAYCFFIPAYIGGPLATLFGPVFAGFARRGRAFGLAFAAALFTHLCLVAWLFYISPTRPIGTFAAVFFGIGALLTYLLALFSIPTLVAKLPPSLWWALRTLGMDYIMIAFLRDFLHPRFNDSLLHLAGYLPFIAIGLAAAVIRIAAYSKKMLRKRARSASAPPAGGSRLEGLSVDRAQR